ncbi:MAG: hypothetical protein PHR64_00895 [Candidatus Shapirobacteria bacterium]|nr:hypothetical protein [Candidatus Shapirobacteria bacterium]MDD5073895.1 hypothetical protein [Candidatus Shapirobacteria bacterium]MDD5481489.1 hypothetical protein [Candidatus Shapirobacteria bacterium]
MKNKKTIIVIVALILAITLIAGLVLGMDKVRNLFGQATGQQQPQGVRVTNVTANSATIVWQTTIPVIGQIEYGTTPGSFLLRSAETNQTANHNLTLSPLLPETIYYFRIRVADQVYDDNGAPYSFTTKAITETISPSPTLPPQPEAALPEEPETGPNTSDSFPEITPQATPTTISQTTPQGEEAEYTLGDFVEKFGTSDPEFDLNEDGIVNSQDWSLYQQQNP